MTCALAHPSHAIQVPLPTRLAVGVGTRVHRVREHVVDAQIRWFNPLDGFTRDTSKWKQQLLRAKPQPHAADGAQLGEALEHGADGAADRFVRIQADLAILLAPDQPDRQPAPELAARRFVANAPIQPRAKDVEFSLRHSAL